MVLLHCVSNYPANLADVNLRAMQTLQVAFKYRLATLTTRSGLRRLSAVALGACVIEKHFTLDKQLPGPDHKASLEPKELKVMISGIRKVEQAMGDGRKIPASSEEDTRRVARRSLALKEDVPEGEVIQAEMLTALRPAGGIPQFTLLSCRAQGCSSFESRDYFAVERS